MTSHDAPVIYLDHAATAPTRPAVQEAMREVLAAGYGNAEAAHRRGREGRVRVEQARVDLARVLGANPADIIFTGTGTEADNLGTQGLIQECIDKGERPHVVSTVIEHPAVATTLRALADRDLIELDQAVPGPDGRIDPAAINELVRADTKLVSVMLANNETGAVNGIVTIAELAHAAGAVMHTDAVQAALTLELQPIIAACDAVALSAHKVGGPTGIGVAVIKRGTGCMPVVHGGGHERSLRPGTHAIHQIVGAAIAFGAAATGRDELHQRLAPLRQQLEDAVEAAGGRVIGPEGTDRLVTHVGAWFAGADREEVLMVLDQAGLCVTTGSACSSGAVSASATQRALGLSDGAYVRMTMGWTTTAAEIDQACSLLADAAQAGAFAPLTSVTV